MSHYAKPFFRKSRGLWYVRIAGQQHTNARSSNKPTMATARRNATASPQTRLADVERT